MAYNTALCEWHQINIQAGKAKMTIFFKYMSGSELLAPFGKYVEIFGKACENKAALLILLILYFKKSNLSLGENLFMK